MTYKKKISFFLMLKNLINNIIFRFKSDLLLKSRSDTYKYINCIKEAIKSQEKFNNFKKNNNYNLILEHSTFEEGLEYIKCISRDNSDLIKKINDLKQNDKIGNPNKYYYPNLKINISPTTLRYIKVASDLKKFFGDINLNIVEIGCGYGGQFLILSKIFNIKSYLLIDLPIVNLLINKYLKCHQIKQTYKIKNFKEIKDSNNYDLLISNYGFSELPIKIQIFYLNKIITKSKRGYLTMNSGKKNSFFKNHLTLKEIRKYLPNIKIIPEEPLTAKENYIIIWGNNK